MNTVIHVERKENCLLCRVFCGLCCLVSKIYTFFFTPRRKSKFKIERGGDAVTTLILFDSAAVSVGD